MTQTPYKYEIPYGPKVKVKPKGPAVEFKDDVQNTLQEAMVSKFSAVSFGYYRDDYIRYFVSSFNRRIPLVNRGYYNRVAAMRKVMMNFVDFSPIGKIQIVSLGAGFDTSFWYLKDVMKGQKLQHLLNRQLKFFEIDFPNVMAEKAKIIERNPILSEEMPNLTSYTSQPVSKDSEPIILLNSDIYTCLGSDLSKRNNLDKLINLLIQSNFDRNTPTLFLLECFLIYLEAEEGDAILRWIASLSNTLGVAAVYQQIRPNDNFGKVMIDHMDRKKCPLKSIHAYPDIEDQLTRLTNCGFPLVTSKDLNYIYDKCLDKSEILRVQQLELFDEIEEWRLINSHYCITVGVVASDENEAYAQDFISVWQPVNVNQLYFSSDDILKAKSQSSLVNMATLHCEQQEESAKYNRMVLSASYRSLNQMTSDSNSNSVDVLSNTFCHNRNPLEDDSNITSYRGSLLCKMVDSLQQEPTTLHKSEPMTRDSFLIKISQSDKDETDTTPSIFHKEYEDPPTNITDEVDMSKLVKTKSSAGAPIGEGCAGRGS